MWHDVSDFIILRHGVSLRPSADVCLGLSSQDARGAAEGLEAVPIRSM